MAGVREGMYRVPVRYLNGNSADMLFWDAVYYLFECHGWTDPRRQRHVETNNQQLMTLTGLSRRQINHQRNTIFTQPAPYRLYEEESSEPWAYTFVLPDYEEVLRQDVIHKPVGLLEHGWLAHLYAISGNSRFPIIILNRFLARPQGRRELTVPELRQRCQHPERRTLPDTSQIYAGLELLVAWSLVSRLDETTYRLNADRLAVAPAAEEPPAPPPIEPPVLQAARQATPELAAYVAELADLGRFDLAAHAADMLRDVAYLRSPIEQDLLRQKVKRHRTAPPSPQRWRELWRGFCQSRTRRSERRAGRKHNLPFDEQAAHDVALVAPDMAACRLQWARLVLWLDDPDYILRDAASIDVQLSAAGRVLWQRPLTAEHEVMRHDLTALFARVTAPQLRLRAAAAAPLPRVTLSAQLEARCL